MKKNIEMYGAKFLDKIKRKSSELCKILLREDIPLTEQSFSSCVVHHKDGEDVSGEVGNGNKEAFHVNCRVQNI